MFKIAYCAGHYIGTAGKRLPASLDKNQTREWILNDRVADHFAKAAAEYEDVELLRTDDPTGKTFIDIPERVKNANDHKADLYIDMHHNAAGRVFSGGGVEAYSYPGSVNGKKYRDAIYSAVIAAGGIRGNRTSPLQEKRYDTLVMTNMPAVLMEYGYMDSKIDAPIILTDAYAKKVAYGTMAGIAKVAGLKKKPKTDFETEYTLEEFVRDIQSVIGAKIDGIPGPETLSKTPTISSVKNRKHPAVKFIQKRLNALGYSDVGVADGIAGNKFNLAVIQFQEDNRCWVDGEITAKNKTWRKLLEME